MRKLSRIFVALALVAFAAALSPQMASAQALDGFIQSQEYLDWLGAGQSVTSTGLTSTVKVGPYSGEFDPYGARTVTSNKFALYCVDYLHWASNAQGVVNVYGIGGDVGNVGTTRHDDAGKYLKAAYLSSMFETYEGAGNQTFMWSALHAAIWRTTSGVDIATGAVKDQADIFFGMGIGGFTGENWYVLSSVELADPDYQNGNYDGTGQEFLVRRVPVPEPSSILLLATGLLLLLGVRGRRFGDTLA